MIKFINRLLKNPVLPVGLKFMSLLAFGFMAYTGFQAHSTNTNILKELRNTNLGNLFVWSYWWPLIIIGAVFLGRIWCFMCPVELVTSLAARIGLKLKRPKWMLSGWVTTAFYIAILFIGIQVLKVHRDPAMMAVYLLTIAGVAVITGLVFEKNTLCRHVCPVGFLLGLYSRIAPFGWRVKNKDICKSCTDKSCVKKDYSYNISSKSCGVDLYPANIENNSDCILCTGCLKACGKYKSSKIEGRPNPGFSFIGFARGLYEHKPIRTAEAVFLMIVSGFVISEILSEWKATDAMLTAVPGYIQNILGVNSAIASGLIYSVVIFLALPVLIWVVPFVAHRMRGGLMTWGTYIRNFGVAFIPLMAAAHVCKAILKMTSRIPYVSHAFADMPGMDTAIKIASGQLSVQLIPLWEYWFITVLMLFIMISGIIISVKTIISINKTIRHEAGTATSHFHLIPSLYGSIFLVTVVLWRFMILH